MATKLEELTKDLPPSVRLLIREALDHTNIKNPNDPIFELMMVLGIWARYFQSIPNCVEKASNDAGRSFDARLTQFQLLAQQIQSTIDKLEATPKALETLFPSETVARNIAGKVDAHFRALPLMQLESDVNRIEQSLNHLLGKKGELGLAARVDNSIGRLEETVKEVKKLDPKRTPWWKFAVCILAGAVLTGGLTWTNISRSASRVNGDLTKALSALTDLDSKLLSTRKALDALAQRIEGVPQQKVDKIVNVARNDGETVLLIKESDIEGITRLNGYVRISME